MILAIDPGTTQSAYVLWDGERVVDSGIQANDVLLDVVESAAKAGVELLAIEQIRSYGMAVGAETFDTVHWSGRFHQRWEDLCESPVGLVPRQEIKMHICHSPRAKDPNVRQALIDRFGDTGTKKHPGPLYGVKSHIWAALAVAVYVHDKRAAG